MENPPKLGELAPTSAFRDAIHIAVDIVTSRFILCPGQWVKYCEDQLTFEEEQRGLNLVVYCESDDPDRVGIIDPFLLARTIAPGLPVYLLFAPGTVTSLRHVYSHPKLDELARKRRELVLAQYDKKKDSE